MHRSAHHLESGFPDILESPEDGGTLEMIVIRPGSKERVVLEKCELSPEGGVHGDNWANGCWMSLPDGSPHPDVQVAMINARLLDLLAGEKERWPLAGDQLVVDLDLSKTNLRPGDRLEVGRVTLEITEVVHSGCGAFRDRYGADALKFVNSERGKELRLRGIYARIVEAGTVRVGDEIRKI